MRAAVVLLFELRSLAANEWSSHWNVLSVVASYQAAVQFQRTLDVWSHMAVGSQTEAWHGHLYIHACEFVGLFLGPGLTKTDVATAG